MIRPLVALSLVLACACSPQARLNSLLKNHPELGRRDTITRIDTIIVPRVATDTVFRTQITKDTVIIRENNLTVKYYNDGKTTYLKGTCDTIRIIREVPVTVNTFEVKPETTWEKAWRWFKDFLIPLLLGAVVILLILQYRKRPKLPI